MIPYFEIDAIDVFGLFNIYPFGVLVGVGLLLGQWLIRRRGAEVGIDDEDIFNLVMWTVGFGFVVSHWTEVFLYHPEKLRRVGLFALVKVWDGLSSYGGFLGALIGMTWYTRRVRRPWLLHADLLVQGLVVGWIFGRAGCSVAHDHPGRLTDFFMAVQYPGGARHDLGLYEMLYTLAVLFPAIMLLRRFKVPQGTYIATVVMLYAPVRFFLDFLRAEQFGNSDVRYLGLTPGQYFSLLALAGGIYLLIRVRRPPAAPVPETKGTRKRKRRR